MARLRLFANLREAAGTSDTTVPGGTVAEVLANAADRFGTEFARAVPIARVWVNGEEAAPDAAVADADEVALIPPVSGGATVVQSPMALEVGLVVAITAALFIANSISLQWLAVTIVLASGVWAFDITDVTTRRGMAVSAAPVLAGVTGAAMATYRFGVPGAASATAIAALAAMVWAVLVPRQRSMESIAASAVLAVVGALGVSSVILLRLASTDATLSFLVVAAAAIALMGISSRFEMASMDPAVVGMLGAVVAGGVAATLWADELWPTLAASGGAALALVAGRNIGALMRADGLYLGGGSLPGSLHHLDGLFAAAGAFWLVLYVLA